MAKLAIIDMQKELKSDKGKVIYKEYIKIIENYLIPILGKMHVDNITYDVLEKYEKKREKVMNRIPTRSTVLNHNAALNRVFDKAIQKGFMFESSKPTLKAYGKLSERRAEFSLDEARAIKRNFDSWIKKGRTDSKELRALLRDYVAMLLDTGARPGKELLNLRWVEVELTYKPKKFQTDEVDEEGNLADYIQTNPTVHLKIAQAKTKPRTANGYIETIQALRRVAERNYGKKLYQLIEEKNEDYIFRYKEIVTRRQQKPSRQAKLIKPTSFSKLFDTYLKEHKLLIDPITKQKRVLYSLRHTYATFQILYENINPNVLARQMGTSMQMIDKFYSHVDSIKAADLLRGSKIHDLLSKDIAVNEKYKYSANNKGK
jgi:integrase